MKKRMRAWQDKDYELFKAWKSATRAAEKASAELDKALNALRDAEARATSTKKEQWRAGAAYAAHHELRQQEQRKADREAE